MTDSTPHPGLLRSVAFGDPTAEADAIYLFDKNCFLETDIYDRCTRLTGPLFIVGRRGSGKSATCMALSRRLPQERHVLAVEISPHGFHFAHAKELARAMLAHTGINWEFLFTSIWATTLRASWAQRFPSAAEPTGPTRNRLIGPRPCGAPLSIARSTKRDTIESR